MAGGLFFCLVSPGVICSMSGDLLVVKSLVSSLNFPQKFICV